MAFVTFVFFQVFNLLNVRNDLRSVFSRETLENRSAFVAIAAVIVAARRSSSRWTSLHGFFTTTDLTSGQWLACVVDRLGHPVGRRARQDRAAGPRPTPTGRRRRFERYRGGQLQTAKRRDEPLIHRPRTTTGPPETRRGTDTTQMTTVARLGIVVDVDGMVQTGTPRRQWRRIRGLLRPSARDLRSPFGMPQLVRALVIEAGDAPCGCPKLGSRPLTCCFAADGSPA